MKKFLFLIICTLMPLFASAQFGPQPYAVLSDSNTVLTFYYNELYEAYRNPMFAGDPFDDEELRGWHNQRESIISVVIDPSFANYSGLTSTAFWFTDLTNLHSISGLEYLNTSNVKDMTAMFGRCSRLTSIQLENFNTENVEEMMAMFAGCTGLQQLNLASFNTSRVTIMLGMFAGCTGLTTIYVGSNWSTAGVTESLEMFMECTSLVGENGTAFSADHINHEYAHIDGGPNNPGYFTAGSSSQDGPWWQELYATIERGAEVLIQARNNGNVDPWMVEELEMFLERGNEIYNEHTASEEEVRHMTEELNWIIREVEEAMNQPVSTDPEPYAVLSDNNTVLTFYYDTEKSARGGMDVGPFGSVEERPWNNVCASITSVIFDSSFANCTTITSTFHWFNNCENLANISGIENLSTANVTEMSSMFSGCKSLTSLDLSHFNTANVKRMNGMFSECSSLISLDLSSFNTENVGDMYKMLSDCSSLTSLDVSNFNTSRVGMLGRMFYNCSSLTSLDLSSFHVHAEFSEFMFAGCNSLVTIYSNDWDLHFDIEGDYRGMFDDCFSLVGGRGTKWDSNHTDEKYAHIDGGTSNPGYFTDINGSEGEASFDGLTARVSGSATLDQAFESVGGRAVAAQTIAAIIWNGDEALTSEMLNGINNPNLLVYVTEASKAPSGIQNLVINGTAEEIVLTDASGNNNFYCPQAFTAQSISYTRNFSQTTQIDVCRGWETICLPFTVQSVRHQSHGALTPFGGGDNGYPFWLRQLSGNGLTRATQIQANVPYLISMPNNTVYPSVYNQAGNVTFSASNVTVPVTSAQTASGAGVTLRAAFQQVAQGSGVYALNVGEARGEYPEGSVFEQNYRGIRPFQAYTNHNSGTRFITLMSLGLGGDDATGIDAMLMDNEESNNDTWYSLDGRRLDSKPTKKGVYIRSGKKIVIK